MNIINKKYCFVDDWFIQRVFKGLSEDVNLLYKKFLETNLTFSSFAGLWRKLKFASIFGGRYLPAEVLEYTEGVLHYSKAYLFSHQIKAVVFGIYFVYAIYMKQPMKGKISKLRLTLTEFKELKRNFKLLREKNYEDAAEIFVYLFRNSAFLYVASTMQGGIEIGFTKYFRSSDYNDLDPREMTDPFDRSLLDSYDNVSQLYSEKKKEAYGDCADFEVKSDFLEEMKKRLQGFGEKTEMVTVECDITLPKERENDGYGALRQKIKKNAFAKGAAEPSTSSAQQPALHNVKRKKQIKIEFQSEQTAVNEKEPGEAIYTSFDLNVFD